MVYQIEDENERGERDRAYRALSERILSGDLAPGVRLVEATLSSQLGLSRTPLREALFRLEREGFVQTHLRRGFSVRALSEREAREIFGIVSSLEVLALRQSWPQAASLARELRTLNRRLGRSRRSPAEAVEADQEFHRLLVSRCPNRTLLGLLSTLHMHVLRYEYAHMADEILLDTSVQAHDAIVRGLEERKLEAACKAIERNWLDGIAALRSYVA